MTGYDGPLPCIDNAALYDAVLFDDTPEDERQQAVHRAAALCAACPAKCDQMVTTDTGLRELVLLEPEWMPPPREGKPEPELPAFGKKRVRQHAMVSDYVKPDDRVVVWARLASQRASAGMPLAAIADDLCVTEETAARLLAYARTELAA